MVDNIIKTQIIGEFDRYDFLESKDKIWFKNLTITSNDEEPNRTFIGKAFIEKNNALHLIGQLTYEDKVAFDAELLLNDQDEYEIIQPISVLIIKDN
jgi:hypothetical protein